MKQQIKYILFFILFLLINTFPLIFPAIWNGFPLIYSDSGTYIGSGFNSEVPIDRPIIYGLFVMFTYMGTSIWCVLIMQSWIVAFFIYKMVNRFTQRNTFLVTTIIIWFLSFTTGLSNYTSQIMPDIFSAIVIIGLALLISTKKMSFSDYVVALIVIFTSITHMSNLILTLGMLLVVLILLVFRQVDKIVFFRIMAIIALSFLSILSVNKYYTNKFQLARAGNIFVIARLIETGIVREYLQDNCYKYHYTLCDKIEKIPNLGTNFIWDIDNSPLYDGGCKNTDWVYCWEAKNEEYGAIVKDIITTPDYVKELIPIYARDFYNQVIDFNIGPLTPQREGSSPQGVIQKVMPKELTSYKSTHQYQDTLMFTIESNIQLIVVSISFVVFLLFVAMGRKINVVKNNIVFILILILGLLGNALTVELFSTVLDRYQARVIWLLPLLVIVLCWNFLWNESKFFLRAGTGILSFTFVIFESNF